MQNYIFSYSACSYIVECNIATCWLYSLAYSQTTILALGVIASTRAENAGSSVLANKNKTPFCTGHGLAI